MYSIVRVIQDVTNTEDWQVIETPARIGDCINQTTVIIFSDGTDARWYITVPVDVSKPDWTPDAWVNAQPLSAFTVGDVTVTTTTVTQQMLPRPEYRARRARLGWNPDTQAVLTIKKALIIEHAGRTGFEIGKNKIYSLGGYLTRLNLSVHGVYLENTQPMIDNGHTEIGEWDFTPVGEMTLIPFRSEGVTYKDDHCFEYSLSRSENPSGCDSTYFFVFGGRLFGIDQPVLTMNDSLLRCMLSKEALINIFCASVVELGVDYGISKVSTDVNSLGYLTSELLSLDGLRKLLDHNLSFLIQVKSPRLDVSTVPIFNRSRHTMIVPTADRLPIRNMDGKVPTYLMKQIDNDYIYTIPREQHTEYKSDSWSLEDGVLTVPSLDPYHRLLVSPCHQVLIQKRALSYTV